MLNARLSLYLALPMILVGYTAIGWVLTAYHVPAIAWIGTGIATLHLIWSGVGAIALTVVWIVSLIWAGVFYKSWWVDFPSPTMIFWTGALGASWILAITVCMTLAITSGQLSRNGVERFPAVLLLALITSLGLKLGHWLYHQPF